MQYLLMCYFDEELWASRCNVGRRGTASELEWSACQLFRGQSYQAFEWVKRMPNPMPGTESELEIRQVSKADDFGEEFTPELRERWEHLRAKAEGKK